MTDLIPTESNNLNLVQARPLDQNPAAVYLGSLSPSGRATMLQALNRIAGILQPGADALSLDWSQVHFQHVAAIRAQLVESLKAATVNKYLCALRGVLKAAWQLGFMSADNYRLAASVKSVKGETILAGAELTSGELGALMTDCNNDPSPAGVRDAAIIAIMYAAGLRRHEVTALQLANYDQASGRLVVLGKGNKERTAYLTNGAAEALGDWLAIRGSDSGALFWRLTQRGALVPGQLTTQAIYKILAKRAARAGVKAFSPHDLRRTFISDLLDAGADIATIARMAGHASVVTTQRYDRRPEATKKKAAGLLHVPYRRRS